MTYSTQSISLSIIVVHRAIVSVREGPAFEAWSPVCISSVHLFCSLPLSENKMDKWNGKCLCCMYRSCEYTLKYAPLLYDSVYSEVHADLLLLSSCFSITKSIENITCIFQPMSEQNIFIHVKCLRRWTSGFYTALQKLALLSTRLLFPQNTGWLAN